MGFNVEGKNNSQNAGQAVRDKRSIRVKEPKTHFWLWYCLCKCNSKNSLRHD